MRSAKLTAPDAAFRISSRRLSSPSSSISRSSWPAPARWLRVAVVHVGQIGELGSLSWFTRDRKRR